MRKRLSGIGCMHSWDKGCEALTTLLGKRLSCIGCKVVIKTVMHWLHSGDKGCQALAALWEKGCQALGALRVKRLADTACTMGKRLSGVDCTVMPCGVRCPARKGFQAVGAQFEKGHRHCFIKIKSLFKSFRNNIQHSDHSGTAGHCFKAPLA